jgi:hypothetical protein
MYYPGGGENIMGGNTLLQGDVPTAEITSMEAIVLY